MKTETSILKEIDDIETRFAVEYDMLSHGFTSMDEWDSISTKLEDRKAALENELRLFQLPNVRYLVKEGNA